MPGAEPVAVVTALEEEMRPLLRRLLRGRFRGLSLEPGVCGDGPVRAQYALNDLLERQRMAGMLALGVAGGLEPGLPRGQLLVGRTILRAGEPPLAAHEPWLRRAERAGARPAAFLTETRLIASVDGKAAAFRESSAAAVDLESYVWAQEALRRRLPFAVVRCVLDTAEEDLPDLVARAQRDDGSVSRPKVALGALRAPWHIPRLMSLARRTAAASELLADFAERFLRDTS